MSPPGAARDAAALAAAWHRLLQDDAAARPQFEVLFERAATAADRTTAALCGAGMVLAYAIEFADWRRLGLWIERFQSSVGDDGGLGLALSAIDRLRIDSALITLPSLDGGCGFDARCEAAAERAARAMDDLPGLAPDERMLHSKMLLDYYSLRHQVPQIEQVAAFGHEQVRRAGVSALWQARWWMLMLLNHDYFGHSAAAGHAAEQVKSLLDRHGLPTVRFELACIEMSAALKADDLLQAERLYRELESLRPLVRPGRLPQGLRAQALLQARRGEYAAALERVQLLLGLCDQVAVPRRDQGAYEVLRAYCLAGLERWPDALAVLEALRADQQGTQGELLEAIIGTVQALRALHQGSAQAADLCARVMVRCAELHFNRFLLPLPEAAARLIEVGLDQGVVPEFLAAAVHDRRLQPADPTREDWPWRLKVEVLGPLRLWRDGVALSGAGAAKAQRKPLELLRLLAANGGGPMPQEAVIDELWPSLEADAPKASFEMAVSRLRKLLGLPDLVRVADGQVMLDAGRCWIDAAAFERLCQRGDAASLHRALAIYRAPLLAGQALGGRMRTARERLALRHEQAVRERTQALLAGGEAEPAVALLRSALVHDPLAETLHRGLIEALALQGERAEALACYRRLCDVLRSSLGIGPSAQTERLVAAIRSGESIARPS